MRLKDLKNQIRSITREIALLVDENKRLAPYTQPSKYDKNNRELSANSRVWAKDTRENIQYNNDKIAYATEELRSYQKQAEKITRRNLFKQGS